MPPRLTSLDTREHEPAVHALLAAAQIHRTPDDAIARGPTIAEEYAASDRLSLWALERDGQPLAVAGVEHHPEDRLLELHDLAVERSHRRTGLGRQLIDALRATYPHATIEGNTTPEAAPFYTAIGFDLTETGDRMPTGAAMLRFTWTPDP